MRGTSVSAGQMAMIAYPRVIRRKQFFATWQCVTLLNFFPLVSREICHGYISG